MRSYLQTVDSKKKIINFKHNCCFSDMCCCYWSHFINYVKLFFSRVNSFLDIYEWNHSDQSRITGECDPTKHFSLPVFFIPFNL